jgi:hypothetical protein
MQRGLVAVAGGILLFLTACRESTDCNAVAYPALRIRVQDSGGNPVCDAVVKVTDGDYTQELSAIPSEDCFYAGAYERPGTYAIEASRGGTAATVDGVEVHLTGSCKVLITAQVTLSLSA